MTVEQLCDTLVEIYTRVFGKAPNPEPRIEDTDDRTGTPTKCVDFLGYNVYETLTAEKDIRGEPVKKWAIDTMTSTYSHHSGWDGDVVEVGLYDSPFAAVSEMMGILAKDMASSWLESEVPDDDGPDDDPSDPGDMDGDAGSALASAGFGTDEDYGGALDDGGDW